jgi:hypothetical protein
MRYFLGLLVVLMLAGISNAQVKININFNLNTQPGWGPTGYDYVEYYFLPDLDVYYSVPQHLYYYNENGQWISNSFLPYRYNSYNLYTAYKVVLNEKEPWKNDRIYREKYSTFRNRHDQESIRDSKDPKYFHNRYNSNHKSWLQEHKGNKGEHRGNLRNNNSFKQKQNNNEKMRKENKGQEKKKGKGRK